MRLKGIDNHHYTNRLIMWTVIMIDFVMLWMLMAVMPELENWEDDRIHLFWIVCTVSMVVSEYWFSSDFHRRLMGAGEILQRSTMLVITQTLLSYLLLRAFHFTPRIGYYLILMGLVLLLVILLLRLCERWALKQVRKSGYNTRMVTFIGTDPEVDRLQNKLLNNPTYGYMLYSSYASPGDFAALLNHPENLRLGDEVYLCVPRKERELIECTARLCHHRMLKFYYVQPEGEKLNLHSLQLDDMEVMTTYTSPLEDPLNRLLKRVADILFSTLMLIPTALLLPFIAITIKRQSPGPLFFRQQRTGLDGKSFYCYKFRSMHVNEEADRLQAIYDDPRTFPFGNFMRRASIDELPQFWNVLVGNMSVVGPRPHMLAHTEQYDKLIDKYMVRHFVKPGITGWAQVTGFRGETRELWQMEGRVERDIWYIRNWSFWLDLRIIWLTVKLMFKKDKQAY